MTMKLSPALPRRPVGMTIAAAALSIAITTLLFVGVTELFTSDGLLLPNDVIAGRACTDYSSWSERETCVQSLVAASYHRTIAYR
jgi:hypothetical protein